MPRLRRAPSPWLLLPLWLLLTLLILATSPGCSLTRRATWRTPRLAKVHRLQLSHREETSPCLEQAEVAYARARKLDRQSQCCCVDQYFRAARLCWPLVEADIAAGRSTQGRAVRIYRSCLVKLVSAGQQYRRLDPKSGLQVQTEFGNQFIPILYNGFVQRPDQFDQVIPVGRYRSKDLNQFYYCPGLGIAAVGIHCRRPTERFESDRQYSAMNVLLRPSSNAASTGYQLEFSDTRRVMRTMICGQARNLEYDITAPFVYVSAQEEREYLSAFLQPGQTENDTGLFMIEPYQPGKIPIVLVHGLLSDPFTWVNTANEILARPDLRERYQIWGFEYPTGEPIVKSGRVLRDHLREIRQWLDPSRSDPALSQMMLVGHSMGGLVAKLQITCSGEDLWHSVSNCPLENIAATPEARGRLAQSFFFDPSLDVTRVVYIATPHRGSPWARRTIGRIGSRLVEEPSSLEQQHRQLIRDNPNTFSPEFEKRIPTSIDLLRADSPLLLAMDRLPRASYVKQHSIIGKFRPMIGALQSDGVVPVTSARTCPVQSEKLVHANHGGTHQNKEGIGELIRIMRCHVAESQLQLHHPQEQNAPGSPVAKLPSTLDKNPVRVLLTDSPLTINLQDSGWRVRQD